MEIRPVGAELLQTDEQTDRQTWRSWWSIFGILQTELKNPKRLNTLVEQGSIVYHSTKKNNLSSIKNYFCLLQ